MRQKHKTPPNPRITEALLEALAAHTDGALLIRSPKVARLLLDFGQDVGLDAVDLVHFDYPAGTLLILRFPFEDGGAAGVEVVGKDEGVRNTRKREL